MKLFEKPIIHITGLTPGGDVSEDDDVSGQSTTDNLCVDYEEWLILFAEDDTSEEAWQAWLKSHESEFGDEGCEFIYPGD